MNVDDGRRFNLSAVSVSDEDRALRECLVRELRGFWKRTEGSNQFFVGDYDPRRTVLGFYVR
jgi:hypothetical protein